MIGFLTGTALPISVLRQPGRLLERPVALRTGLATGVPFSKSALTTTRTPTYKARIRASIRRSSRRLRTSLSTESALGETELTLHAHHQRGAIRSPLASPSPGDRPVRNPTSEPPPSRATPYGINRLTALPSMLPCPCQAFGSRLLHCKSRSRDLSAVTSTHHGALGHTEGDRVRSGCPRL